MSCSIPPEIQDLIIDHLHDEPAALEACYLVSKSWIDRTRKHLFAVVRFTTFGLDFGLWKKAFPDPAKSPAHHTRTLFIHNPHFTTAPGADVILAFCSIVRLDVNTGGYEGVSFVPLHGLSPVITSLHLTVTSLPNLEIFGLVCSLPLLEDLSLFSLDFQRADESWSTPLSSPRFTGSLELRVLGGIQSATRLLLDLPDGLHFTRIAVRWLYEDDIESTMDLVSRCSDTLEYLGITNFFPGTFPSVPVPNRQPTATSRRTQGGVA